MDAHRFDTITRALTYGHSRRALTRLLSGLTLGGLLRASWEEPAAAKKKKPCPPCKKRKKGKCKANLPDGTACSSGTCQSGRCVPCIPQCAGRVCGSDGCGGECGVPCTGRRQVCNAAGQCVCPAGLKFCSQFGGRCDECCSDTECPPYEVCASDYGEPNHCVCIVPPRRCGICLAPGCPADACGAQCNPNAPNCCPPLTCQEEGGP